VDIGGAAEFAARIGLGAEMVENAWLAAKDGEASSVGVQGDGHIRSRVRPHELDHRAGYPDLFMKLASFRVFALDRPALPGVDDAGTWSSPGGLVFGACRRRWPRVSRALGMYPAEHERDHRGVRAS